MKIYFAASIRGGRDDVLIYSELIKLLQKYGTVLTEHVADKNLNDFGESSLDDEKIHDRDMNWLLESDIVIAEVTNPSLGVGYEIGRAIENDKKVVCLYKVKENKKISAMILGSNKIKSFNYRNLHELENFLNKIFQSLTKKPS
jgi:nucleoside 2-deoxyribosyltransferase